MRKKFLVTFVLLSIILLGAFLRLHAVSPFKIYPDSYQSLVVTQNILTYHSVLGYLGPQGMVYPDFFSWTRPVYPLLIILGMFVSNNMTHVAQTIAFLAGLLALPVAFLLCSLIVPPSKNDLRTVIFCGIAGAFLLAASFHHTIWSGFIMTDTTGIFFLFVFLVSFFWNLPTQHRLRDFLTGIFFAFAVMTRYEYVVLVLPVTIFLFLQKIPVFSKLFFLFLGFTVVVTIVIVALFPAQSIGAILITQLQDFLPFFLLSIVFLPILISLTRRFLKRLTQGLFYTVLLLFAVSFLSEGFLGIRAFILHDFLLICFFVAGSFLLLKKQTPLLFFVLLAVLTLGATYYRVNPAMDRYLTHVIPFFLIPASYAFKEIFLTKKPFLWEKLVRILLILLILLQICFTYQGLGYLRDNSWFKIAYEEKAAHDIKKYVPKNTLLITSQPEPYFTVLQRSTQSITNTYPYVFLDTFPKNQQIIIVEDMGMHVYFPQFSSFLKKNMQDKKIAVLWIHKNYHFGDSVYKEKFPLIIYRATIGELQTKTGQKKDN
ncbi:MAG: hypothetical protein AAB553_01620 [Patescibacteria group bacterium]